MDYAPNSDIVKASDAARAPTASRICSILPLSEKAMGRFWRLHNAIEEMGKDAGNMGSKDEAFERVENEMGKKLAEHGKRVGAYASQLGLRIGMGETGALNLFWDGFLHDVGKVLVNGDLLENGRKLDADEMGEVRAHAEFGGLLVGSIEWLRETESATKHHHENWDGSGYPHGLEGEGIPLASRILRVVDSFDALVDKERTYKKPLEYKEAVAELRKEAGKQFDPKIVEEFIRMLESMGMLESI